MYYIVSTIILLKYVYPVVRELKNTNVKFLLNGICFQMFLLHTVIFMYKQIKIVVVTVFICLLVP